MKLVPILVAVVCILLVAGFIVIGNSDVKVAQSPTVYDIPLTE